MKRAEIRNSLEQAHAAFHELIDSLSEEDLGRRASGSAWNVGDVATHLVMSAEHVPALIGALRRGKDYMNYPPFAFEPIKVVFTRWTARRLSRKELSRRFDAAHRSVVSLLETIGDGEWERAGHAYGEAFWTVEDALFHQREHVQEHLEQIRRAVGRAESGSYAE